MSSSPTDQSQTQPVMTPASPTTTSAPSSFNIGAVIGAIVGVLVLFIVIALAIFLWYYFKRRKQTWQTHSFHESPLPAANDNVSSFRVLSTWENAVTSQQKQKEVSECTPAQMGYVTPDLIAGTNDDALQYGRLRNDTITTELTNLPTIDELHEREFENPGFQMDLDESFDTSKFNGQIVLVDEETNEEDESDVERKLSVTPTDLETDVTIIEPGLRDEKIIESHNEENDHVSIKESGLSDDLNADIDDLGSTKESGFLDDLNVEFRDPSHTMDLVNEASLKEIEHGFDNAGFEMDTDLEGDGILSGSHPASLDIDSSS